MNRTGEYKQTGTRTETYTAKQIRQFAEKGVITQEQYKQITGEEY